MLKISCNEAKKLDSNALCSLLVLIRTVNKKDMDNISVIMNELSDRRSNGDLFNFEEYILKLENDYKDLNNQYLFNTNQVEDDWY